MAKTRKTGWPRGGEIKQWMRCLLRRAGAIDELTDRVKYTSLAIEELSKRGCLDEAVRELERLLRSLPGDDGFHHVQVLELGAQIHLDAGKMRKMEEYLQRILATKPLHTRPSAKGWEVQVVREFKVFHGLLDPSEASNEEERVEATFNMSMRRTDALIDKNDKAAAKVELARVKKIVPRMAEDWQQRNSYEALLDRYMKLKD